jgi:hypothetical protein
MEIGVHGLIILPAVAKHKMQPEKKEKKELATALPR